jgi:hypothetical protein
LGGTNYDLNKQKELLVKKKEAKKNAGDQSPWLALSESPKVDEQDEVVELRSE